MYVFEANTILRHFHFFISFFEKKSFVYEAHNFNYYKKIIKTERMTETGKQFPDVSKQPYIVCSYTPRFLR